MMLSYALISTTTAILVSIGMVSSSAYHVQLDTAEECSCHCTGSYAESWSVCKKVSRLEEELFYVKGVIEKRNRHVKELEDLRERMELQEMLFEDLLKVVEELKETKGANDFLPKPEALVVTDNGEDMQGDSNRETRLVDDGELAKNVSSLLAKVEVVQEELKSEKRVRRHLEEDLNETRTSIKLLDDRLHNVSIESRNELVEEIALTTLESLNKTLFEEHLQKLYYRLDGVAYRNETKDLYQHLDEVRDSVSYSDQLAVELRSVSDAVVNLSDSLTAELTLKDARLNVLESKTEELEGLDEQLGLVMNASELMHGGLDEMWKDIQDIRNHTDHITKELQEQLTLRDNFTDAMSAEVLARIERLSSELDKMADEIEEVKKPIGSLSHNLGELSKDLQLSENRLEAMVIGTENKLSGFALQLKNATEQLGVLSKNRIGDLVTRSFCPLPEVDDPHVSMSLEMDPSGHQVLEVRCLPIGKYALSSTSTGMTCVDGRWQGTVPLCIKLLDEHEINRIATEYKATNPCDLHYQGNVPDPYDCSHYFTCSAGSARRQKCINFAHFNPAFKICEPKEYARCDTGTPRTDKLSDIIPTILINRDNVDQAYSMTGTGPKGELIVYPRTGLTLECLFPDTIWGLPTWTFISLPGEDDSSLSLMGDHQVLSNTMVGPNRLTLSVPRASADDSGVYICTTPRGQVNSITVVVKAVQCPPMPLNDEVPHNAYYRPHPDSNGEYSIMSTPVEFQCKGGFKITALCRADGTWSRAAPTLDECPQDGTHSWGCPPIDTSSQPNLILEREDRDSTVMFRCAGSTRLVGNAYTRCFNGTWTHYKLPVCMTKSS